MRAALKAAGKDKASRRSTSMKACRTAFNADYRPKLPQGVRRRRLESACSPWFKKKRPSHKEMTMHAGKIDRRRAICPRRQRARPAQRSAKSR